MSNLESIVPPLELCKKIPEGKFNDSCFVWVVNGDYQPKYQIVDKRKYPFIPEDGATLYPAPTLQEILDALAKMETCPNNLMVVQGENSATAALKLWLELNKE